MARVPHSKRWQARQRGSELKRSWYCELRACLCPAMHVAADCDGVSQHLCTGPQLVADAVRCSIRGRAAPERLPAAGTRQSNALPVLGACAVDRHESNGRASPHGRAPRKEQRVLETPTSCTLAPEQLNSLQCRVKDCARARRAGSTTADQSGSRPRATSSPQLRLGESCTLIDTCTAWLRACGPPAEAPESGRSAL